MRIWPLYNEFHVILRYPVLFDGIWFFFYSTSCALYPLIKAQESRRKVITSQMMRNSFYHMFSPHFYVHKSFLIASEMHNIQTSCQQYCPRFMTSLTSQCNIYSWFPLDNKATTYKITFYHFNFTKFSQKWW